MLDQHALGIGGLIPKLLGLAAGDRSGVRPLLRDRFAHPVAALEMALLLAAAWLSLGQPRLFMILFGIVAISVAAEVALIRAGHPVATDTRFRLWLCAYPLAFAILGAAGWSQATGEYHGEVVALVVLIAAGYVGLVETLWFSVLWSSISAVALVVGIAAAGVVTGESLISVAAIFVGTAFGTSLRDILEDYLGHRQVLIHELRHLHPSDDPFELSGAIVGSLIRWTRIRNATLIWFTDDGRSVLLGVGGEALPPALRARLELPDARDAYLRANAAQGPWITGWTFTETETGYARDLAVAGITAAAYLPIEYQGRLLGILGFATSEAGGGRSALSDQFPLFAEVADVAGTKLGPVLARFTVLSTASSVLDTVLREQAFSPVFQPIRDLATHRIVGYEALTRFQAPIPTESLFLQAATLGRLRELELATLEAAIAASAALPPGCWLSVNSSPELLIDTDVLRPLLRRAQRPIILEISEHVAIAEYGPIAAALERLGPGYSLAVDDAGAGFASLRHILEIKPAYVKLDLGLVQGVAQDATRRALVAGFAHFARDARFTLIAEGIETQADLDVLRRLDVTLGQGYLLGRPQPVAEAASLAVA
jgi:EAL domain-containing protein (putative c-di-GMP-specific phosphodiesterase class I)